MEWLAGLPGGGVFVVRDLPDNDEGVRGLEEGFKPLVVSIAYPGRVSRRVVLTDRHISRHQHASKPRQLAHSGRTLCFWTEYAMD